MEPEDVTVPYEHFIDGVEELTLWIDGIRNIHDDLLKVGLCFLICQLQSRNLPGGASFHLCEKSCLVRSEACSFHLCLYVG